MSSNGYEHMLEKYRDVDEDEIMSGLSKDELARLENEIDREILEKPPESYESDSYTSASTTTDDDSDYEEQREQEAEPIKEEEEAEEIPKATMRPHPPTRSKPEAFTKGKLDKTQLKPVQRFLPRQKSKDKHTFKLPALKKVSGKAAGQNADDSNSELKDELIQAVKKRDKRRTRRSSSYLGGGRRPSAGASRARRNPKVVRYRDGNEHQLDAALVNKNFVTNEMLNLRPKLKKVQIKEPKLVLPEELHGVSFDRITAGAKYKEEEEDDQPPSEDEAEAEPAISEDGNASRSSAFGYDADNDVTPSLSDESYALPGDDSDSKQMQRHKALSESSEAPSDGVATMASTTSTSADSCDVFGELSINPNSVEEMVERVREDDPTLTEVNLNNIHDVPMERFEELAEAMEDNSHVTSLTLANTGLTDRAAKALASMLKRNKTLKKLNIESNFITGEGARRIVSALRKNQRLTELSIDNQRHIFGAKVEMEMSKLLRENTSLLKFGYQFANPGPRMATSSILTKNMDIVRKKRVAEEKRRQHAGLPKRPPLRRQPSSEWYRKERLERLKKLQEQSKLLGLDPSGKIGEKEVEKVLKNMNPEEVSLLERWFTSKLLGMVDKPPEEKTADVPDQSQTKQDEKASTQTSEAKPKDLLRPPPRARRSKSPVASRDDLMDSIRKQNAKLKKVKLRPFESPSRLGNSDSDVEPKHLQKSKTKKESTVDSQTKPQQTEQQKAVEPPQKRTSPLPKDTPQANKDSSRKFNTQSPDNFEKRTSPVPGKKQEVNNDAARQQPKNNSAQTPDNFNKRASPVPKKTQQLKSNATKRESDKAPFCEQVSDKAKKEHSFVSKPTIMKTEPSFDEAVQDRTLSDRATSREDNRKEDRDEDLERLSQKSGDSGRDNVTQRSCSSPEVREWKDGEEYDSDEYEVVEIEVTDSEEEDEKVEEEPKAKSPIIPDKRRSPSSAFTGSRSKAIENRPPPFTGNWNQRSSSPQSQSPVTSASLRSNTRSPLSFSPPTQRSSGTRSPLSSATLRSSLSPPTPRSPNTRSPLSPPTSRSNPLASPAYNRSLSRNSNSSSGNSSPRYSRPTPPRTSRTARSRDADDGAEICPKALSTIESFFAFK